MDTVDVAIVGGGPAGSSAALGAVENDATTVVLEKGVPRSDRDDLGPDSTDAAGFLDYWVDIAGLDPTDLPQSVIEQVLDGAEFHGPTEELYLSETGMPASYPHFGFTFHRAKFDDWLRSRAETAGAEYRVGSSVQSVETDVRGDPTHVLVLANGEEIRADTLVLADGPQRQVTMSVLDSYLPEDRSASTVLSPRTANHIAYQEYRQFPDRIFDRDRLKFWWGWIPGHTAYPWVFPNRDGVARVGLTTPIGLTMSDCTRPTDYPLVHSDDERLPSPREYVRRLLDRLYGDEYDIESDFPIQETGYGKDDGTETYPISSTRPIDSPTKLDVAVVGGAMGATSAFHEGGDHVAMRTGALAGTLAAKGRLDAYNDAWKDAIGDEVLRNVSMAQVVRDYTPEDWDRAISIARTLQKRKSAGVPTVSTALSVGFPGVRLLGAYWWQKLRFGSGRYVQIAEEEYQIE
ncbi:MAG: NAD(P)/FAD-dependent oxidoreductase [Halodesulfurarchaeum sp.]